MMDRTGSPAVQVNGLSSFFPPAECAFFAEHQRAAFLNAKAERFPHCLEVSEALYQKLQLVPTIVKMVRDATEINRDPEVLAARCPYPMENIRTFIESVFAKIDRGEDPNIRMFGYGSLTGLDREKTIGSVAAIPLLLSGWKRYLHSKVASNCTQAHRRVGLRSLIHI